MNRKKKKLLQSIDELDAKIKLSQYKIDLDRRYFASLYDQDQYNLVAMLLPALMIGWKGGKHLRGKKRLKKAAKFGFKTIFSIFRNYSL